MKPSLLVTAMLLALAPPPPPESERRWRCRFCRVELPERVAAVEGALVHPPNRCRYGVPGNCAVPVEDLQPAGSHRATTQLTPFKIGQRVTVRPPVVDVETETDCVESDFVGEWEIVNHGTDKEGGHHYQVKRPGDDAEPLIVEHRFLELAP